MRAEDREGEISLRQIEIRVKESQGFSVWLSSDALTSVSPATFKSRTTCVALKKLDLKHILSRVLGDQTGGGFWPL